jgi:Acyl-CoA carboxylase epsilon subunit
VTTVDRDAPPLLEIASGHPTAEEVAAVVTVLSGLAQPSTSTPPVPVPGGWTDRAAGLRTIPRPGPGAWRLSARHG